MSDDRITDDGERAALGLEPISDDAPTPDQRARAIAEALWDDDPLLGDALRNQCALGRSSVPQVRRGASSSSSHTDCCWATGMSWV